MIINALDDLRENDVWNYQLTKEEARRVMLDTLDFGDIDADELRYR